MRYSPDDSFPLNSLVTHPALGEGKVIRHIPPNKMDVSFGGEIKRLVCGRIPKGSAAEEAHQGSNSLPYSPYGIFPVGSSIKHDNLGIGLVIDYISPNEIDVKFVNAVKRLKCGRIYKSLSSNNLSPHNYKKEFKEQSVHLNTNKNDNTEHKNETILNIDKQQERHIDKEIERQSNDFRTLKEAILHQFPNGFRFSPLNMRLLPQDMTTEMAVNTIKQEMFEKDDGSWLFLEMAGSRDTRQKVLAHAENWLNQYGCFSINALFLSFKDEIQNIHHYNDFVRFLRKLGLEIPLRRNGDFCFHSEKKQQECLEANANMILDILEEANGVLPQSVLLGKMPHLDQETATDIIKRFTHDIHTIDINSIICWQYQQEIYPPDDFAQQLSNVLEKMNKLSFDTTENNINIMLGAIYNTNLLVEYGPPIFRKVIEKHFAGQHPYKWKFGRFIPEVEL